MHTGGYGLAPVKSEPQAAGPASTRMCRGGWPVRSGAVPPADEGLITRPDTAPGLDAVLVPGAVVALVPGQDAAGRAQDWPGSSGKTQLACYLAGSLWRSRSVDLLAWVAATSRAAVLSGYVQAAAELGLDHGGDAESVAARFLAWLAGTGRPWLVVLDDLRDAADLDGLWPAGPAGRLLITTADHATIPARPGVLALPVPAFSTREALTYLSGRLTTDPDQRSGAIDLAADLGCEPAALAQAAAVIISSGISCREYRGYFVQQQAAGGGRGDPPTAAWFAWTAAASHAERLAPGAGTWRLLALAALLGNHGVPLPVFTAPAVGRYLSGPAAAAPAGSAAGAVRPAGPGAGRPGDRRRDGRLGRTGTAGSGPVGRTAGVAGPGGPGRRGCAGRGVAGRSAAVMAGERPCGRAPSACGKPPGTCCGPAGATGCC